MIRRMIRMIILWAMDGDSPGHERLHCKQDAYPGNTRGIFTEPDDTFEFRKLTTEEKLKQWPVRYGR